MNRNILCSMAILILAVLACPGVAQSPDHVYASESLDANVHGSGTINYAGDLAQISNQ